MKKVLTIVIVVAALQIGLVSAADASGGKYHKVYYGETLYSIGRLYDLSPHYLSEVNGLYNPNHIYAGQVLYIPNDGPPYPWYGHKGYGNDGYGHKPAKCQSDCGPGYGQGYQQQGNKGYGQQGYQQQGNKGYGQGYQQQGNKGYGQQGNRGYQQQGNMGYGQQGNMGRGQQGNMGYKQQGNKGYGQQGHIGGQGWNNNCGQSKCGSSYGYDYTGYYYGGQGKQYSYTCGYYSNCW